ncbi:MAG: septum formation initiator family protein [Acidobacteriota bacterium]
MSKAADIYWDNGQAIRRNTAEPRSATGPQLISFTLIAAMFGMLCLTINYRAITELRGEVNENRGLTDQIQNLTDENLALQDEIHNLKTDPKTIEREAKKLGLARSTEKSLVPAN